MSYRTSNTIIYVQAAKKELNSFDRGLYFLSYLKVRITAREKAGVFNKQMFIDATDLHPRTAQTHIDRLIEKGYVKELNNGNYRIVMQIKTFGGFKGSLMTLMPDKQVMSYSWKNISKFRADLVEILIEENRRYKQILSEKRVKEVDQRDGSITYVKSDGSVRGMHQFVALEYGKCLTGLPISTLSKYRSLTSLASYSWKMTTLYCGEDYLKFTSIKTKLEFFKGKMIEHNGVLYLSPISRRKSKLFINVNWLNNADKGNNRLLKKSVTQTIQG